MKVGAFLFVLLSVCFFCLGVEWGEGEPWGASNGGLGDEDRIWISYVPHRPPIGYDLKQNKQTKYVSYEKKILRSSGIKTKSVSEMAKGFPPRLRLLYSSGFERQPSRFLGCTR
jgi:hypothetical protein